jgi:hypothetical protein
VLRFLAFDALVINRENIMQKDLIKRYGVTHVPLVFKTRADHSHQRLQDHFFKPYDAMLHEFKEMTMRAPFQSVPHSDAP